MKTNSFLTDTFVLETARNALSVNPFLKAGGRENTTEVVSASDLFMQSAFSEG
jgi:hypothetical protein